MALITGRDCDLTINTKSYSGVINTFELSFDSTASEYETLDGTVAGPGTETGTLSITFAFDGDATDSLFAALWSAAETGTAVAYVATLGTRTLTGNAVAARPTANATGGEVSEATVEMTLSGMPTLGTVAAP